MLYISNLFMLNQHESVHVLSFNVIRQLLQLFIILISIIQFQYCGQSLLRNIQCRHLISALNAWAARHNTRLHILLPPSSLGMDARMNSQLNVALIRKLLYVDH